MSPRKKDMAFNLVRPCVDCPFLQANNLHLRADRAEEIAAGLEHETFMCHKTQYRHTTQHCAGALIIMAKNKQWGDLQQISMRIGLFKPNRLDLTAEVFPSFDDFVRFYGGTPRPWRLRRKRA